MNRLLVIPARGGSKRIKDKNLSKFNGIPIIKSVLENARSSNLFTHIHVSTDSQAIFDVVSKFGFRPDFYRPDNLSGDFVPLYDVASFVYEKFKIYGKMFDEVWLLMPLAALITKETLKDINQFSMESDPMKIIIGVCKYEVPIDWAMIKKQSFELEPISNERIFQRSQDLEDFYYDAGQFCIYKKEFLDFPLSSDKKIEYIPKNLVGYELSRKCSVDVDTEEDLDFLKVLIRASE